MDIKLKKTPVRPMSFETSEIKELGVFLILFLWILYAVKGT